MVRPKSTHNMKKIDAFRDGCLPKIWPHLLAWEDLKQRVAQDGQGNDGWERVFRMDQDRIPKVTLTRGKPGEISQGRPNVVTWQQTLTAELKEKNLTKGEAQHAAQDRPLKPSLCRTQEDED